MSFIRCSIVPTSRSHADSSGWTPPAAPPPEESTYDREGPLGLLVLLVVNLVLVSGTPVVLSDTPVVLSDTPVVVSDTPVVVSGTPVVVSGTPVVVSGTPVVVSDPPVVLSDTPVVVSGTPESLPVDCSDLYSNGFGNSGVYMIFPAGPTSPAQVFCEMCSMDAPDSNKWTLMYKGLIMVQSSRNAMTTQTV
ncbi:unnamed protein product [Boreogadus saida]